MMIFVPVKLSMTKCVNSKLERMLSILRLQKHVCISDIYHQVAMFSIVELEIERWQPSP